MVKEALVVTFETVVMLVESFLTAEGRVRKRWNCRKVVGGG